MEAAVTGIALAVLSVLLAARLGYDYAPGWGLLWLAVIFFAGSLVLPAIGVTMRAEDALNLMVASSVAVGLGSIFLFAAVSTFRRI